MGPRRPALVVLFVAIVFTGCEARELPAGFVHDFALELDGSGEVTVSGEARAWTAFKKIGDPANPDGTVTETAIRSIFERAGLRVTETRAVTASGRRLAAVTASFRNLNGLTGQQAFPDLVIQSSVEGQRLRVFGVWRAPTDAARPAVASDDAVEIRLRVRGRVYEARGAADARGGNLLWAVPFPQALSGGAIDFGATLGTEPPLPAWLRPAVLTALAIIVLSSVALFLAWRRPRARRGPRRPDDDSPESDFSKYDPTSPA